MNQQDQQDIFWMNHAYQLALQAQAQNEVPVGAILVAENKIIGEGKNSPIQLHDPTAHAEILALRSGGQQLKNYRLVDTTLYVTLEPCVLCVGAMIHARIKRLVFGAYDLKTGAVQSVFQMLDTQKFNHHIDWQGGVLAEKCGLLLSEFFQKRRRSF